MQITEEIHRIEPVRVANAYLIIGADGLTLVDTGMPRSAPSVLAFIHGLGLEPRDVRTIVITHADTDHIGSAAALKRETGAAVAIHDADADTLSGRGSGKQPKGLLGLVFRVISAFMKVERMEPDILLHDGDEIAGMRVMHVPGHTRGSIALIREGAIVFSGDAVLADRAGAVKRPRERMAADYEQALASAEQILELHPTLILPGHGEPARNAR